MAETKICPFQSFGAREQTEICVKNGCALWVHTPGHEETGACAIAVLAARLSSIDGRLITIAARPK